MLKTLYIRNYAIIEEITVTFDSGMTAITGETGAGKSILMGALSLILGERADSKSLFYPDQKCIIEGIFAIETHPTLQHVLETNDIDYLPELCIRREITPQGRSRVFINDTPVTLNILSKVASNLIDLHRQFDTLELQQQEFQLEIIDELAKNEKQRNAYHETFLLWQKRKSDLDQLRESNKQIRQELDYHQYLFNELHQLNLQEDELEQAEIELNKLMHSEAIKTHLQQATYLLQESEQPILAQLKQVLQLCDQHVQQVPELTSVVHRIQSCLEELKDIENEIVLASDATYYDEERIQHLNERLNDGNRLLKKHHVQQTKELLQLQLVLEQKIAQATGADNDESKLAEEVASLYVSLEVLAGNLSESRKKVFAGFEKQVNVLLKKVGMPNAKLEIMHQTIGYHQQGIDQIEFLFDANQSGKAQPIQKVASGGELSRLMLCIKSMLANAKALPTLIFDEIDTGISGETAVQVGLIMKDLGKHHQLITITHLPQIAGKAQHHLFIYKKENAQGKISTNMRKLTDEERVEALAEMLSGKKPAQQSKEIARELMKN